MGRVGGVNRNGNGVARNGFSKRMQKVPHRKKIAQKGPINPNALPKDVKRQNFIRREFARYVRGIRALKPVRAIGTGVDYHYLFKRGGKEYNITLDMKFSFGMLGERTISARVGPNRKLINESGWVMAVNRKGQLELFKTSALSEYVSRHWGSIDKSKMIHKVGYDQIPVNLENLYEVTGVKPMVFSGAKESIPEMLSAIRDATAPKIPVRNGLPLPANGFGKKPVQIRPQKPLVGRNSDKRAEQLAKGATQRKPVVRNK